MATLEAYVSSYGVTATQSTSAYHEFARVVEVKLAGFETKLAPSTRNVGEDTLKAQWQAAMEFGASAHAGSPHAYKY